MSAHEKSLRIARLVHAGDAGSKHGRPNSTRRGQPQQRLYDATIAEHSACQADWRFTLAHSEITIWEVLLTFKLSDFQKGMLTTTGAVTTTCTAFPIALQGFPFASVDPVQVVDQLV